MTSNSSTPSSTARFTSPATSALYSATLLVAIPDRLAARVEHVPVLALEDVAVRRRPGVAPGAAVREKPEPSRSPPAERFHILTFT